MVRKLFATRDEYTLTIARAALGFVMLAHGAQKMLGWFGGPGFSAALNGLSHVAPTPLAFLAIMAEFFGGIGLIAGLLGRVAAFGILCNMAVAVTLVHGRVGFFMNWAGQQKGEGIEYHLLAIALALVVIIGGSGALSLDRLLSGGQAAARGWQPATQPD